MKMKASAIPMILVVVTISVLLFFPTSYYYKDYGPLKDENQPPYCCINNNFKALFTYFFPTTPNIDFRGSSSSSFKNEEESSVKEAVAKTLEKGKAALEESARSAANLAKDTFSNTHNNQEEL